MAIIITNETGNSIETKSSPKQPSTTITLSEYISKCQRKAWYYYRWYSLSDISISEGRLQKAIEHNSNAVINELIDEGVYIMPAQESLNTAGRKVICKIEGAVAGLQEARKSKHLLKTFLYSSKDFKKFESAVQNGHEYCLEDSDYTEVQMLMSIAGFDRAYVVVTCMETYSREYTRIFAKTEIAEYKSVLYKIVFNNIIPPRISDNPVWSDCKGCEFNSVCHRGQVPRVSCRTCKHFSIYKGDLKCKKRPESMFPNYQSSGCDEYRGV